MKMVMLAVLVDESENVRRVVELINKCDDPLRSVKHRLIAVVDPVEVVGAVVVVVQVTSWVRAVQVKMVV